MGEVYAAEHVRLDKQVAVKFLREELAGDRRCVERFQREVRSLAAVRDANVVNILDTGELPGGVPFFVMERLFGQDLERILACAPLEVARVVALGRDACNGLAAVHAAGLVHRDIKPANLFVTQGRRGELTKLLDFGVVKLGATGTTRGGAILGTIRYMAPEQLMDSASVGPACDLYGLGAVLYHCLAGRPAHQASSEPKLMFEILNRRPPPLRKLRPDLSPALTSLVDRALSPDPGDRPGSADEFHGALAASRPKSGVSVGTATADTTLGPDSTANLEALSSARRVGKKAPIVLGAVALLGVSFTLLLRMQSSPRSDGASSEPATATRTPGASTSLPLSASARELALPAAARSASEPAPAPSASPLLEKATPRAPSSGTQSRRPPATPELAAATESATLELGAEPVWASVHLDGREVGTTPLVLSQVTPGAHRVEAFSQGQGTPQVLTFTLRPSETRRLVFRFADTQAGSSSPEAENAPR